MGIHYNFMRIFENLPIQYRTHAKNRTAPKPCVARGCTVCTLLYGFQGADVIALLSLCIACIKLGMEINKNAKK